MAVGGTITDLDPVISHLRRLYLHALGGGKVAPEDLSLAISLLEMQQARPPVPPAPKTGLVAHIEATSPERLMEESIRERYGPDWRPDPGDGP